MAPLAIKIRNRRQRAIALIEMALVLPLLVLLSFAVLEYGWMFYRNGAIENAARQGARMGVRPDASSGTVTTGISNAMTNAGLAGSGYTVTMSPSNLSTLPTGAPFSVVVSVPYAAISLTGFSLLPVPTNLRAEVTMAREGP